MASVRGMAGVLDGPPPTRAGDVVWQRGKLYGGTRFADGRRHRLAVTSMDVYEICVDLRPGVGDIDFVAALDGYLGLLQREGRIESWRLLRRKLGLGGTHEFKVLIETNDLDQLDRAFRLVSQRDEPVEGAHFGVNSLVTNFHAALYRDFPDAHRQRGAERF
jgi:hypothetical protein